jgi:hypothetical protein
MKGRTSASIVGIATALLLMACASKGPVSSTGRASADAGGDAELAAEYRSLIENAMGRTVCREQSETGSRIHTHEVCFTRVQLDDERERMLELLDDARTTNGSDR